MKIILCDSGDKFDLSQIEEEALDFRPYCSCSFAGTATCAFMPSFDSFGYCSQQYSSCSFSRPPTSLCGTFNNPNTCAAGGGT